MREWTARSCEGIGSISDFAREFMHKNFFLDLFDSSAMLPKAVERSEARYKMGGGGGGYHFVCPDWQNWQCGLFAYPQNSSFLNAICPASRCFTVLKQEQWISSTFNKEKLYKP